MPNPWLKPNDAALAGTVATVFKGETLRGLLLNAYAFGTMGMIAGIAAIAAFIAGLVMLILGGLGLMHARRVSPAADILTGHPATDGAPAPHRRPPTPATSPAATAWSPPHPAAQTAATQHDLQLRSASPEL